MNAIARVRTARSDHAARSCVRAALGRFAARAALQGADGQGDVPGSGVSPTTALSPRGAAHSSPFRDLSSAAKDFSPRCRDRRPAGRSSAGPRPAHHPHDRSRLVGCGHGPNADRLRRPDRWHTGHQPMRRSELLRHQWRQPAGGGLQLLTRWAKCAVAGGRLAAGGRGPVKKAAQLCLEAMIATSAVTSVAAAPVGTARSRSAAPTSARRPNSRSAHSPAEGCR